jgi:glycosyltransferase involved in cell wall biosynthesis
MILGIDASNIRAGGGVTHLIELLRFAVPQKYEVDSIIIWANTSVLERIKEQPWLTKASPSLLERSLPYRIFWQKFRLHAAAKQAKCDALFVPGGSDSSGFTPIITMSQNMLPFNLNELFRFGLSFLTLKLLLLRYTQSTTFNKAAGIVFLSKYAKETIANNRKVINKKSKIIPHGIDSRFFLPPRTSIKEFSQTNPCKVTYVSIIDMYKHQWHVVDAIGRLRSTGIPVILNLVGPAYKPALAKLEKTLNRIDPNREFIFYHGSVPYTELDRLYKASDIGIFASSCENLPNILLEMMASGLPIACSDRAPMPEVLQKAGVYFNPEAPDEIALALQTLIENSSLRLEKAQNAYKLAQQFTWELCANETFQFISETTKYWKSSRSVNNQTDQK